MRETMSELEYGEYLKELSGKTFGAINDLLRRKIITAKQCHDFTDEYYEAMSDPKLIIKLYKKVKKIKTDYEKRQNSPQQELVFQ